MDSKVAAMFQVQAYDGYWEVTGTIEAYCNTNLGISKKAIPYFRFVSVA